MKFICLSVLILCGCQAPKPIQTTTIQSFISRAQPLIADSPPTVMLLSNADVLIEWTGEASVAGYNLYYGDHSRAYQFQIAAGTNVSETVSNLDVGKEYYFAATAYDTNGIESDFSDEAIYLVPGWIQMTFAFSQSVSSVEVQSSEDLQHWSSQDVKHVIMTANRCTCRATLDRPSKFFRAVGVAP